MKKNQNKKELLNIGEVAKIFGVHQQTLRRWDEENKLRAIRIGKLGHRKYRKSEIEKLIKV